MTRGILDFTASVWYYARYLSKRQGKEMKVKRMEKVVYIANPPSPANSTDKW